VLRELFHVASAVPVRAVDVECELLRARHLEGEHELRHGAAPVVELQRDAAAAAARVPTTCLQPRAEPILAGGRMAPDCPLPRREFADG